MILKVNIQSFSHEKFLYTSIRRMIKNIINVHLFKSEMYLADIGRQFWHSTTFICEMFAMSQKRVVACQRNV